MSNSKDNMFRDLQIFSAVVESKSYKDAADKLSINISNVGRRIKALEEKLHHSLVIKDSRSISITSEGMTLYKTFIGQEQSFLNMLEEFQDLPTTTGGTITIAIPSGIIEYILSDKLPLYVKNHPLITLNMNCQNRELNVVAERYDFAILRHIPQQNQLKIRKIYEIKPQLYCTSEYINRYGMPKSLKELESHMLVGRIHDNLKKSDYLYAIRGNETFEIMDNRRFLTNSFTSDEKVIKSHEVIVGGIDLLYQDGLKDGSIIKVLPEYYFQINLESFYLVSNGNKHQRKIVQELMDYIIQIFAELKN